MKSFVPKIVAIATIFLFSACTVLEKCQSPEREITAKIPTGSRNLIQDLPPTSEEKIISAWGFFVGKNEFLTVSHFLPKGAIIQNFTEKQRDSEQDLLLLGSSACGEIPDRAEKNPEKGEEIFDCTTGKFRGKVEKKENTIAENALGETTFLEGLFFVSGDFASGESGKPFCNEKKEVLGILVAKNETGGFLRGIMDITKFLH